MKRMFYAAHTPSFLSLPLPPRSPSLILFLSLPLPFSFSFSLRLILRPVSVAISLRRAKYIPYLPPITSSLSCYLIRTPPTRSRIIINLHARCPTPSTFRPVTRSSAPADVFIRYNETSRDAQRNTYRFIQLVERLLY